MKAWSSTDGWPAASAAASISSTALQIPMIAARSPPAFTWWYWALICVLWPDSISAGDCGLVNCSRPRSRNGLKVMIGTPRSLACCSGCSMRGLLLPGFWPKNRMQSVWAKSSSVTVPTGTPMLIGKATDVVSWHMLELSGRLLLPYSRASRAYR